MDKIQHWRPEGQMKSIDRCNIWLHVGGKNENWAKVYLLWNIFEKHRNLYASQLMNPFYLILM